MGKRVAMMTAVTVVLWAALMVDVCWCFSSSRISSDDLVGENVKVKSEELKKDAAQITHGAKEMADWVHGKYKQSFGVEQENARKAPARATDTMNTAVSEASEYASEKTGEAADKAYEIAGRMKDFASDKADQVIRMVSEGSNEGGERLEKAMEYEMNKASNAYDETKQKMNMASDKAYKAKESIADAIAPGRSRAVDAYDMHSDCSDDDGGDDDDDNDDHSKERMAHTSNNFDAYDHMASDWDSDTFHHTMLEAIDNGRNRISNAYEEAKRILNMGIDMAMEKGADAKEAIEKTMEHGKEGRNHVRDEAREQINIASNKAGGAMGYAINGDEMEDFEESVNKAGEAYKTAKEKMTGEAKAAYEDGKERFSKATRAVGDKMRKDKQEL